MNRLRTRLILIFLAATLAPLAVTLWITTTLLDRSLKYASTAELEQISSSLTQAGRELYQRACDDVKAESVAGRLKPVVYRGSGRERWPEEVDDFFQSGENERFTLTGAEGERLRYLVRKGNEVWAWTQDMGGVAMGRMASTMVSAIRMRPSGVAPYASVRRFWIGEKN